MINDDRIRPGVGVVVTLRDLGECRSRVILDDVRSSEPRRETDWAFDLFFTHKDLDSDAVDRMCLPDDEYRGLGEAVMARLLALSKRSK
jgi:hypothetical protein